MRGIRAFAAAAACACMAMAAATDSEKVVRLADIPQPAQRAIQSKAGEGRLDQIVEVIEGGEKNYEVEVSRAGRSWNFTVAESGTLLDEEVALSEAPAAVQKTIHAHLSRNKLEAITRVFDEGKTTYEVAVSHRGKAREFTLNEDGRVLSMQVFTNELPAKLQSAIKQAAANGDLGDIYKITDEDEVSYDVEITQGKRARTLTFDEDAKLVGEEEEVNLADTPQPVQSAIKMKVADGAKLGAITRSTEQGEVTYEVEFIKFGKHDTVTLAADGKVGK